MATSKNSSPEPTSDSGTEPATKAGKGQATPTRKAQEAANKRPLIVNDRKQAAKDARAAANVQREKARAGMAAGDERYLTKRDKGPQRRFARDYVDARYSFGELLVPFMILVIVASFFQGFEKLSILVMYGFLAILIIDALFLSIGLRRRLANKFGTANIERGVRWYAMMRALQMRPMRLPRPQVGRRQYPN